MSQFGGSQRIKSVAPHSDREAARTVVREVREIREDSRRSDRHREPRERSRREHSRGPSVRSDVVPVAMSGQQFDPYDRAPEDRQKDVCPRRQSAVGDFFGPYEPVVRGSLHIEGVNYAKYEAQKHRSSYISAFLDAMRDDIVCAPPPPSLSPARNHTPALPHHPHIPSLQISEVGNGVRREDILLQLYPGAIKTVVLHYDRYDGPDTQANDPTLVDAEWSVKCDYAIRARDVQRQQNVAMALYTALGEEQMFSTHKMRRIYRERFDPQGDVSKIAIVKPPADEKQPQQQQQQQQTRAIASPPRPMNTSLITSPIVGATPPQMQQQQLPQPLPAHLQTQPQHDAAAMRVSPMPGSIARQGQYGMPPPPQQQQQQPLPLPPQHLMQGLPPQAGGSDVFESSGISPYRPTGDPSAGAGAALGPAGASGSSFLPPQASTIQPQLLSSGCVGNDGYMTMNGRRGVAVFIPEEALSQRNPSTSYQPSVAKTPPSLLAP